RERLYAPALAARIAAFDPERALAELYESSAAREALDRMIQTDVRTRLPDHPLMIRDGMALAHGPEARGPCLDQRLAAFCASLPGRVIVRAWRTPIIEKELARQYLPAEALRRPKQGFSSPLSYALRAEYVRLSGPVH